VPALFDILSTEQDKNMQIFRLLHLAVPLPLLLLTACRPQVSAKPSGPDPSDVLMQHLVNRVGELNAQISKLKLEVAVHDSKCLDENIAALQGHPIHHKPDSLAQLRAIGKEQEDDRERLVQYLLDSDAAIEDHNRRHPEHQWAVPKFGPREICGDCTPERADRELQIKREAAELAKN